MAVNDSRKIPIVACIDIEPDDRAIDLHQRADWLGFEQTWKYFAQLRPSLEDATESPARLNWFLRMDPQISHVYGSASWAVTRYREFISGMQTAGDEIGLHPHVWRLDEHQQIWVSDFADQEWIEKCVRQSFAEFEDCFRKPCRSSRFGDRFLNNPTVKLIERLGSRYDLSIEPGRKPQDLAEAFTGSLPDYTVAPRHHYRPSKSDFLRPGGMLLRRKLWMIPISTGSLNWAVSPVLVKPDDCDQKTPPLHATYEGSLDCVDQRWILGWIYDTKRPDETIIVDIFDNDQPLGRYAADIFRSDLLLAGKGAGAHAFFVPVPKDKADGTPHRISARVAGTDVEIGNSPAEVVWVEDQASDDYWTLNLTANSGLFCRLFDSLVSEQQASYLAFNMRTEAPLSREYMSYLERNLAHIISHPLARNFVFTTPAEAIRILAE